MNLSCCWGPQCYLTFQQRVPDSGAWGFQDEVPKFKQLYLNPGILCDDWELSLVLKTMKRYKLG